MAAALRRFVLQLAAPMAWRTSSRSFTSRTSRTSSASRVFQEHSCRGHRHDIESVIMSYDVNLVLTQTVIGEDANLQVEPKDAVRGGILANCKELSLIAEPIVGDNATNDRSSMVGSET